MAIRRIHIQEFLSLAAQHPVIDVRSPGEYVHGHIPVAKSLPLFSDEERKVVGTAYKQESRERAIKIGLDYFGVKMKKMVEEVETICNLKADDHPSSKTILIYCWRGGMRSGGVAWLMDLYGFTVYTLIGGYKSFRKHVGEVLSAPHPYKIVGGYTGSGKTHLLKKLEQLDEKVIDLETLAQHKGSAFGNIGMPDQPTQEMFENLLAEKLDYSLLTPDHSPHWLEDESQRIGHINLPQQFWQNMRSSPVYFLEIPFEERLDHIVKEYGKLDRERMVNAIIRIKKRLGGLDTKNAINYLLEDNVKECFRILLRYYDKYYLKGLHNRENLPALLHTISCNTVTADNARLLMQDPL
jgi:tRNA 2-selenouridine synthase